MATDDPIAGSPPGNPPIDVDAALLEVSHCRTVLQMAAEFINQNRPEPELDAAWLYLHDRLREHLDRIDLALGAMVAAADAIDPPG